MRSDLEYLDDIADQNAFSGGDGGFKNGMLPSPSRRRRSRKSRDAARRISLGLSRTEQAAALFETEDYP
jgi:hypothetical protein